MNKCFFHNPGSKSPHSGTYVATHSDMLPLHSLLCRVKKATIDRPELAHSWAKVNW